MALFGKRIKSNERNSNVETQTEVPDNHYKTCDNCNNIFHYLDFENNMFKCPNCDKYFTVHAKSRIEMIVDKGSFKELYKDMEFRNPINFPDYDLKHEQNKFKTQLSDAIMCGVAKIDNKKIHIAAMDNRFLMGSMGTIVGEKLTLIIEEATKRKTPIIIFSTSGGARMQEGMYSLFQMAKTSNALKRHSEENLLYISVLTNPTTGGVTASFAMLGDINIAEKDSLIGFAGPRVIEQTINQKLPEGFQSAKFQKEKGFVDLVLKREEIKGKLKQLINIHK